MNTLDSEENIYSKQIFQTC